MTTSSWKTKPFAVGAMSLIVSCSLLMSGTGTVRANSTAPECAARDLRMVMLIEEHGDRKDISAERLAIAASVMQAARNACSAGRTEIGLAFYDLIATEIIDVALRH